MTDLLPQGYIKRTAGDLLVVATAAADNRWKECKTRQAELSALEAALVGIEAKNEEASRQAVRKYEEEQADHQTKRAQKHWIIRWWIPKQLTTGFCYTVQREKDTQTAILQAKYLGEAARSAWCATLRWVDRLKALPADAEVLIAVEEMDMLRLAAQITPTTEGKPCLPPK
jgi:hypothetical protein